MKKLLCFILGVITYISFIPLLESVTELLCCKLEKYKGEATKRVLTLNKEIQDLQESLEPVCTQAIGYHIDASDYDEDDDWEEDKLKNKIGF